MARLRFLLFGLLSATPLLGQQQFTMTPSSGPVAGGTEVTITGDFGGWPYGFDFGGVPARSATRVDDRTWRLVTPAHLPGDAEVRIFEYDMYLANDLRFRFEGKPSDAFERLLLPLFTPPVQGAYGSDFRTDFSAYLKEGERTELFGFTETCAVRTCLPLGPEYPVVLLTPYPELRPVDLERLGKPGRFMYVEKSKVDSLALNLRVYDVSRAAENFGTELPVVRSREFARDYAPIVLNGVPTEDGFRNTLRIYSNESADVVIVLTGAGAPIVRQLRLTPGETMFDPAYAVFSEFPSNVGPLKATVALVSPAYLPQLPSPELWAFVSVTNNDTQLITTITPQP